MLIRTVTATFLARGDTATPVKAALLAAAVNIAFKVMLMGPLAQVGLALATAIGAWINFGLVLWFALRAGLFRFDARLQASTARLAGAGIAMALALWIAFAPVTRLSATLPHLRDETALAIMAVIGGGVYVGLVLALFGRQLLAMLKRRRT